MDAAGQLTLEIMNTENYGNGRFSANIQLTLGETSLYFQSSTTSDDDWKKVKHGLEQRVQGPKITLNRARQTYGQSNYISFDEVAGVVRLDISLRAGEDDSMDNMGVSINATRPLEQCRQAFVDLATRVIELFP